MNLINDDEKRILWSEIDTKCFRYEWKTENWSNIAICVLRAQSDNDLSSEIKE